MDGRAIKAIVVSVRAKDRAVKPSGSEEILLFKCSKCGEEVVVSRNAHNRAISHARGRELTFVCVQCAVDRSGIPLEFSHPELMHKVENSALVGILEMEENGDKLTSSFQIVMGKGFYRLSEKAMEKVLNFGNHIFEAVSDPEANESTLIDFSGQATSSLSEPPPHEPTETDFW